MHTLLMLMFPLAEALFAANLDQALESARNREWRSAAALLDQAYADDPELFEANSLHYLRGRMAAEQRDWARASDEFARIGPQNPLRPLASWHGAAAAIQLGAMERALQLVDELPASFPAELKMQLARNAPPPLTLRVYNSLTTRGARLERALLLGQPQALWSLLRESTADDIALESARRLSPLARTTEEWLTLGRTFLAHRQFAEAVGAYQQLNSNPAYAAEARYQIARARFLKGDYANAIADYRSIAADFPDTDWQKDSLNQIANAYWRMRQYPEAEKAYLQYIEKYGAKTIAEGAVRDLADVYRSQGETAKAIRLIDQTIARRPTTATRQVLLFTKAKILYGEKRYAAALEIFRQLGQMRIQSAPGGTTADEVLYFQALCLSQSGSPTAARTIWQRLASNPLTYYGQKAAERLRGSTASQETAVLQVCARGTDNAYTGALRRLAAMRRPVRDGGSTPGSAISELMFMELWEEASLWMDQERRPDAQLAADLGYVSGRFHRAIAQAGRLPATSADAMPLLYPAGFRTAICAESAPYMLDPLWLHAIVWQESKYNPNAQSAAAARGLMQFIPDTAEFIAPSAGVTNMTLERLYEPETNIRLGAHYWAMLLQEFKSPELALAAYNGGPENVRRWVDKMTVADPELFISEIGFVETKRYVQAVFEARAAYGKLN